MSNPEYYNLMFIQDEPMNKITELGCDWVKGDSALAYYWNQHAKTQATIQGEWVYTGDRYSQDTEGYFWFQGRSDTLHDYKDADSPFPGNEPQRFVENYGTAGGQITLDYIDAERHTGHTPDLSQMTGLFEKMVMFVREHTSA